MTTEQPPGNAMLPLVDQPDTTSPGRVFRLVPWRQRALLAPFAYVVSAARDFLIYGTDEGPATRAAQRSGAKEPMKMPAVKAPAKTSSPSVAATPTSARLEAAVRKAASAKAKARDAKAALKKAKKSFRLARKAAKAARKDVAALQATIANAEERAAAAAKRARATRRAPKTDGSTTAASTTPDPPVAPKPARRTRRAAASTRSDAEVVLTEPLATPSEAIGGSASDSST